MLRDMAMKLYSDLTDSLRSILPGIDRVSCLIEGLGAAHWTSTPFEVQLK